MRGRGKENFRKYYTYETMEERRQRLETQKRIKKMKRNNEVLEAKINFLVAEMNKMIELVKSCCGPSPNKQTQKPDK